MNAWLAGHRAAILEVAKRHGAARVRVFGSMARDDATEGSDVDLLLDLEPDCSLLDLAEMKAELEDRLHRHVDVVTESSLHWFIRPRILAEARPL